MILKKEIVVLESGPSENHFRPAIDPLFRSAALAYTTRVIGIILSGLLDDGSSGLWAVKRCGGITIVQDPADAASSDMPMSAISHVKPDLILRIAEMGSVIKRLVNQRPPKPPPLPKDIEAEERLMETTNLSLVEKKELIGKSTPFSCPACNGPLYEKKLGGLRTFQCNIGHRYTARLLASDGRNKAEATLWTALEGLEENAEILTVVAEDEQQQGNVLSANGLRKNAQDSLRRADLLRQMLTENRQK